MLARRPQPVTVERLRQLLAYDAKTGVFTWRVDRASNAPAGSVAGCVERYYRRIHIDGVRAYAHHLAWLYIHGEWPSLEIDHRDKNKLNNAIGNLRPATRLQNARNRKLGKSNKSGTSGVSFDAGRQKWVAFIQTEKKKTYLGSTNDIEEAVALRRRAEKRYYGEFAP